MAWGEPGTGGFNATEAGSGLLGRVFIEVRKSNGTYQRFDNLSLDGGTVKTLNLPGSTIRVNADRLTNVNVEIIDSEGGS